MKAFFIHIVCITLLAIPDLYAQTTKNIERLQYARELLEQGTRDNDSSQIAEGNYLLAKRHADALNVEEAYTRYYLALVIYSRLQNHYKAGKVYLRMASLELKQRHFEKAKHYIHDAIRIFSAHNLPEGLMSAYKLLGEIYLGEDTEPGDTDLAVSGVPLDTALHYLQKAEVIAIAGGDENDLAGTRFIIGQLYLKLRDKKALDHLEYAVSVYSKNKVGTTLIRSRTALANAWLILGVPKEAGKILSGSQRVIDKDRSTVTIWAEAGHHTVYSQYYRAVGEWEKALDHREIATNIYNRFAKSERNENISKWRILLETEKKEHELKLRNQELESREKMIAQQRLFLVLATFFLVLLALLSYFLYKNYKKQQSLSRRNAFLVQEQSHRVKNNLQIVSSMLSLQQEHLSDTSSQKVLSDSQTRINSMVLLHRQLYQNSDIELIDIEELFYDIIHSVAVTYGKEQFQSVLEMDVKYLAPDLATSVGVILNELVVNSFKHAFDDGVPRIEIASRQLQSIVEITYQDFGGINIGEIFENPDKKGFGLQLIDMILFQIDGNLKYRFRNGPVFTLTFKNKPS